LVFWGHKKHIPRKGASVLNAQVIRNQKVVLAEYTALAGNFQQATMQILQKLESFLIFWMENQRTKWESWMKKTLFSVECEDMGQSF